MSLYGRFLVTMLVLDGLGYALVVLLTPPNSAVQLVALFPVLLVAPLVARRLVYGDWFTASVFGRGDDTVDEAEEREEESE